MAEGLGTLGYAPQAADYGAGVRDLIDREVERRRAEEARRMKLAEKQGDLAAKRAAEDEKFIYDTLSVDHGRFIRESKQQELRDMYNDLTKFSVGLVNKAGGLGKLGIDEKLAMRQERQNLLSEIKSKDAWIKNYEKYRDIVAKYPDNPIMKQKWADLNTKIHAGEDVDEYDFASLVTAKPRGYDELLKEGMGLATKVEEGRVPQFAREYIAREAAHRTPEEQQSLYRSMTGVKQRRDGKGMIISFGTGKRDPQSKFFQVDRDGMPVVKPNPNTTNKLNIPTNLVVDEDVDVEAVGEGISGNIVEINKDGVVVDAFYSTGDKWEDAEGVTPIQARKDAEKYRLKPGTKDKYQKKVSGERRKKRLTIKGDDARRLVYEQYPGFEEQAQQSAIPAWGKYAERTISLNEPFTYGDRKYNIKEYSPGSYVVEDVNTGSTKIMRSEEVEKILSQMGKTLRNAKR